MDTNISIEQQYALKYNDFHSKIISSLQNLRNESDFVDVTLYCEEHSFSAHKVILSACSSYFRKILKENPCQHPVIILKDVSKQIMEHLLLFIYNGEVQLETNELDNFIKTAKVLKIQGLSEIEQKNINNKTISQTTQTLNDVITPGDLSPELLKIETSNDSDDLIILDNEPEKTEKEVSVTDTSNFSVTSNRSKSSESNTTNFTEFFNEKTSQNNYYRTEQINVKKDSTMCPYCKRNYSNTSNLRAHIHNVHSSSINWVSCRFCDKKLKTKHYLINHEMSAHGIAQRSKRPKTSEFTNQDGSGNKDLS